MYAHGRENSRRLLSNSFNNSSKLDNTWRTNNKRGWTAASAQTASTYLTVLNVRPDPEENDFTRRFERDPISRQWENLSILSALETIYLFPECSIPYLYSAEIARERETERAAGIE